MATPAGFVAVGRFDATPVWFSTTGRTWIRAVNRGTPHTPIEAIVPELSGLLAFTQTRGKSFNSPLQPVWSRLVVTAKGA